MAGSTDVDPASGTDARRVLARPDGERFRLALAGSSMTTFMMDRELRYTWMENPALGQQPDTVVGPTDADLLPAPAGPHLMTVKRRVIEHGESIAEDHALALLRCFGVDHAQGFQIGRPPGSRLRRPSNVAGRRLPGAPAL